jgi:hypothetical protein
MKTQYDEDFLRWTEETASALREGRFDGLDWEHIAEEIESLGASERRALESRLTVLLQYLLKWQHQPGHRSNGWRATILEQRLRIDRLLNDMPSLRPELDGNIAENYPVARLAASGETGFPETAFPKECPYTIKQILDRDFLPGD